MKKILLAIGICAAFVIMPAITGLSTTKSISSSLQMPQAGDFDGTFVGGLGRMYKENEEWQFEYHAYLAGVYEVKNRYKIIHGNIYNLEQEQTGNITILNFRWILIGRIRNLEGGSAPIIGFLFTNDENFAGRLMSFFGPAPHIWGQFDPE
jgi:hypothetical protein